MYTVLTVVSVSLTRDAVSPGPVVDFYNLYMYTDLTVGSVSLTRDAVSPSPVVDFYNLYMYTDLTVGSVSLTRGLTELIIFLYSLIWFNMQKLIFTILLANKISLDYDKPSSLHNIYKFQGSFPIKI